MGRWDVKNAGDEKFIQNFDQETSWEGTAWDVDVRM
jgi:hypothetical protein